MRLNPATTVCLTRVPVMKTMMQTKMRMRTRKIARQMTILGARTATNTACRARKSVRTIAAAMRTTTKKPTPAMVKTAVKIQSFSWLCEIIAHHFGGGGGGGARGPARAAGGAGATPGI